MEEKMSIYGVGTVFVPLSALYFLMMVLLTWYFYPAFQINVIPYQVSAILGIALLIVGIPFWILSLITILRTHKADRLVTTGVYRFCRHPLYASWTVFNSLGIALLINSWMVLTTPVFMYVMMRILIKKEETYLQKVFGSAYLEYKKRVPAIIPYGCLKE